MRQRQPPLAAMFMSFSHGDTLMSIARRNGVTLTALAHANHLQSTANSASAIALTIPAGGHPVAAGSLPGVRRRAASRAAAHRHRQ